jgi:tetratricopeptide (TPR) repeat protein
MLFAKPNGSSCVNVREPRPRHPRLACSTIRVTHPILALVAVVVWGAPATPQKPSGQPAMTSMEQAPAQASTSACSAPGFGSVHHPVKTSSPEAQKMFDRGMALDYGFNHNQAQRCFQRAAELDPNMAMAYWGIALVQGTNYNMPVDADGEKRAYASVQKALALSAGGPAKERDYIQALAKRYTDAPNPDYDKLEAAYHDAMREVYKRYPDDLDAATLFAESGMNLHPWKLYDRDGKPAPGTTEIVSVLLSVLKRDPNHLGANHFYIHAVEASAHPETGLASAHRLAGLAPASGHLVHMPAHIYIRTGDHEASEKTNQAAAQADEAYFAVAHPQGIYPMMYYTHNIHFICVENAFMGNYAASLAAARKVQEFVAPHVKELGMLDVFYSLPLQIMVRFHRWGDILAEPQPGASFVFTSGTWHFARALASADAGKLEQARAELAELKRATPAMSKVSGNPVGPHNGEVIPQIMAELVETHIAGAQKQTSAAIEHLRSAVALQDSMDYDEPPDWLYPMREPLGAALLQAGKAAEAESVFREDLKRNPNNARSFFGLAESLKAQRKTAEAAAAQQKFEQGWKRADAKLTLAVM